MSELIKNAKDCVKTNVRIRRTSRFLFFIIGPICIYVLTSVSGLNMYFFYLMLTKFLILFGVYYFTIINFCADTPQYFELWNTSDTRIRMLNERMKVTWWWLAKFIIFSTAFFLLLQYIIGTAKNHLIIVSNSTFTAEEILLILIIILLSLLAVYTEAYWYVARYIKIRIWDKKAGLLEADGKSLVTGMIPIIFPGLIIFIFDVLYIHVRLGIGLGSAEFLGPLLESFGSYVLLILEIIILLIVDIVTYIDGKRQVRSRTTFLVPLSLGLLTRYK